MILYTRDNWHILYTYVSLLVINFTVWHRTLALESFGGLLPISILVDKTLADWLVAQQNCYDKIVGKNCAHGFTVKTL